VVLPKPLMPIGDFPILEVVVKQLVTCGFDHITMAVNHQAELIKAFFAHGAKWGVRIDYSMEDSPLGTMGPLRLVPDLPENFLVMNGDILTDLDFAAFFRRHEECHSIFTVAACRRELCTEYGVLEVGTDGLLTGFREKPVLHYDVSMGIYMASRQVLDFIPAGIPYGFDKLMLDMLRVNRPAAVERHEGYWLDIGRPDDYAQAIDEFESHRRLFLKD
jgi:NDP-sugar pyrophosphorylase family protein